MFLLLLLLLLVAVLSPASVAGYCAGIGSNPSFTNTPRVSQLALNRVSVNWTGMVSRVDCADQERVA